MPGLRVCNRRADPGTRRQRTVHPAQVCLCDLHPAVADGRQAALFERQAMAMAIEQGIVPMTAARHEQ